MTAVIVVRLHIGSVSIAVSKHAAIRYRDRVRPGLSVSAAVVELERVAIGCGRVCR